MCRLTAYLGTDILLEDVLVKPVNSLLQQSLHARETYVLTNGDGFGLGWYAPDISPNPALFTSISPAWNDRNLLSLTSKIKAPCFFAHVRSATTGGVTNYNCHPFRFGKWMLMHNGDINDFSHVKRHLRRLLDDDIYNWIQGDTDSEHLFALFLQMAKDRDLTEVSAVAQLTRDVFHQVHELTMQYGLRGNSALNVCITDGHRLVATRYCTDRRFKPETLHYSIGDRFILKDNRYQMIKESGIPKCVLISSERLNDFSDEWHTVPPHHLLIIDSNLEMHCSAL